jgi:hypothetical protein
MIFLTSDDIAVKLRTNRLDQITNSEPDILTDAERKAIGMVTDFTNQWYDIATELAKTGTARNPTLIRWLVDITTYFIYARIPDAQVPDRVIKDYDDVREDLKMVVNRKLPVALVPKLTDGESTDRFRWGSQPQRENNPYGIGYRNDPTTYS